MSDLIEKEQGILPDNNEKKSTRKKISLKIKKQDINKENNVITTFLIYISPVYVLNMNLWMSFKNMRL